MRVFVIEDNPIDLKLICALLESNGCTTTPMASTEGVLGAIRAERPDIVVLDLHLQGRDGLSLVRELRADDEGRRIPVLAITAYPHRYTREQIQNAGCVGWIIKPIDTRKLVEQVRTACSAGGAGGFQ